MKNNLKTFVILSTEPWGEMMLSKMHFAAELSRQGNRVFFVNPPRPAAFSGVAQTIAQKEGVTIIQLKQLRWRLLLRNKAYPLYKLMTNRYISSIKKLTGPIDEVWCFDPNSFCDLKKFNAPVATLLLYDFYKGKNVASLVKTADGLVSVSTTILDHYKHIPVPQLFLNHGLSRTFVVHAQKRLAESAPKTDEKIRVGYSGNLFIDGIRTDLLQEIISKHHEMEFHFWGPSSSRKSNLSSTYKAKNVNAEELLQFLEQAPNVVLHGVKQQSELAEGLFSMDAFLMLYSFNRNAHHALNSHKLLEYFSTGVVVISTYLSAYEGTELFIMGDKTNEESFPSIFESTMQNLSFHNSPGNVRKRIAFALDNSYEKQILRIRTFIDSAKDLH